MEDIDRTPAGGFPKVEMIELLGPAPGMENTGPELARLEYNNELLNNFKQPKTTEDNNHVGTEN